MTQLFKHRLSNHLIRMAKYLKYVFNDFFVIALLFFVGGLGFAYSDFLKTLRPGHWWISLVIGLVVLISVQFGRFATLVQKPDYVFLLPKDRPMRTYLDRAFCYSSLNGAIIQLVVWFILLPLLKIQFHLTWPGLLSWLAVMLLLKITWLMASLGREFQKPARSTAPILNLLIVPVIVLSVSLLLSSWLGLALALLWSLWLAAVNHRNQQPVNWLHLVRTEAHRMHDIYTVFNMFVDVPNFGSTIRRRRYLDPLFRLIPLSRANTYAYLYWHGFARDKEFSDLYVRLVALGLIILIFTRGLVLPLIMGLVFTYLISFQTIPFYDHFAGNAFVHVYPLSGVNQLKSFQRVLRTLMIVTGVIFAAGWLVAGRSLVSLIGLLVLMFGEVVGMLTIYLPKQAKND